MYNKLQYISQGNTIEEQLLNIHNALDNGCDWIQLRFKNGSQHELHSLAERVKIICDVYLASYIINDNVHLAQELDADGVHLGLSDMNTKEARAILGKTKIIGGTANTFDDVVIQVKNGCDYIGLGPYKYTKTKENLSPVLGLAGYHSIIKRMTDQNIEIPIFAIGGIELENIDSLMKTGIYGIAVSGLITQSEDPFQLITQLNNNLYGNIIV
jgi:thiamine-phosphate pyrophosphorylase